MEETLDDNLNEGNFNLPTEFKNGLQTQGYWARFLAIVSFVFIGIIIIIFLITGSTMMSLFDGPFGSGLGIGILIFYSLFLGFFIYIGYLLYSFGTKTLNGLKYDDIDLITEGSKNLGLLFKIYGILIVIVFVIQAISLFGLLLR
jgi:hypothetical protein